MGFVSDLGGSGRILVLGRMFGFGLILSLLLLFLVVYDSDTKTSRILVESHLIDAEFRSAWMPYFCRSGLPVVTTEHFFSFVGHLLPQEKYLDLPRITGRGLQEVARVKRSTAGGFDCWTWDEIKLFPYMGFLV